MSEQRKEYTEQEVKDNLVSAIELQKLQTELQKLRTEMMTARANEIYAMRQISELIAEDKPAITETGAITSENQTVTPTTESK